MCLFCTILVFTICTMVDVISFSDDFNTAHNCITNGIAGTGWDGFVGLDAGETVDTLTVDINCPGHSYIQSTSANRKLASAF